MVWEINNVLNLMYYGLGETNYTHYPNEFGLNGNKHLSRFVMLPV